MSRTGIITGIPMKKIIKINSKGTNIMKFVTTIFDLGDKFNIDGQENIVIQDVDRGSKLALNLLALVECCSLNMGAL